jgi:hypothetical protein
VQTTRKINGKLLALSGIGSGVLLGNNVKTKKDIQNSVDKIRALCNELGVVLIGTCQTEAIYGEITVAENNAAEIKWSNPQCQLSNKVGECEGSFVVDGIGDLAPNARISNLGE